MEGQSGRGYQQHRVISAFAGLYLLNMVYGQFTKYSGPISMTVTV